MFKCFGSAHVMINGDICLILKCAHGYGYDLNLEIDNMCSLMKLEFLIDGIVR